MRCGRPVIPTPTPTTRTPTPTPTAGSIPTEDQQLESGFMGGGDDEEESGEPRRDQSVSSVSLPLTSQTLRTSGGKKEVQLSREDWEKSYTKM